MHTFITFTIMFSDTLSRHATAAIQTLFNHALNPESLTIQRTIPAFREFGDFSLVVFPLLKISRKSPEETATLIGEHLMLLPEIAQYHVVKGFLNLKLSAQAIITALGESAEIQPPAANKAELPVVVEFSSPNTNKPLHLGHIRNNLLGYSVATILEAAGYKVHKVNLVNDRGIHICKSMLAWTLFAHAETPESAGKKGDKLVGDYYVLFDKKYKEELARLKAEGWSEEEAANKSLLMQQAREMLLKWEARDPEILHLWKQMNDWVYAGFDETYKTMGIRFDKIYYESETYLLGREIVNEGLKNKVFFKKEDGSVWVDLSGEGLDEKLLLRADGTSVYMTQDLGTAQLRINDFGTSRLLYVVGNEQNYHFEVLKLIFKKLGRPWADNIFHLSYGMVELPEGKMKSREGTVVDADDLMAEMTATARSMTEELGKIEDFNSEEAENLYDTVGLGALKYFILKVDPRKNMMFDPRESIDFNGNTAPFIQYTYARIKSVLRKAGDYPTLKPESFDGELHPRERSIIVSLSLFSAMVNQAANELSPALLANFIYELAREYNQFYHELTILKEADEFKRTLRLNISRQTAEVLKSGLFLLGIDAPERM